MKKQILASLLIASQSGLAQNLCAPASPEMAAYFTEKSWKVHSVRDNSDIPAIRGFVDDQNRFYMDDLTRRGSFKAEVAVDPTNQSYREFFKYCAAGRNNLVRAMRKGRENNRYVVSVRYLPALKGFANDPLVDQKYKENNVEVRVVFADSSSLSQEVFSDRVKAEVVALIKRQVLEQSNWGTIKLDLTGWDDVVCDMLQGKVSVTVGRDAISNGPLVQQVRQIEPSEVQLAYQSLRDQIPSSMGKEKAIFISGRIFAKLEKGHRISNLGDNKSFELIKNLMTPDMSHIAEINSTALECLIDRMQGYQRPAVQHYINIQFNFPRIEEVESELARPQ